MASSDRFKHESIQDSASIVKYLEALGAGFANEALTFSSEDNTLVLRPTGMITLEVEAKRKDGEIKLSLKFRWREKEKDQDTGGNELTITAAEL